MLSIQRNYDCSRCINRLPSGRCAVLLRPPWGRTCDYYEPDVSLVDAVEDDRIRKRLLRHAEVLRDELETLFPDLTADQVAECMMASAGRSSVSRGVRSRSRRAIAMAAGEIAVECQRCGSVHEVEDVSSLDGTGRCPTCGNDEFSPVGLRGNRGRAREG